jgi:formate hydrogenlyase subunit 3/multisubunit Na+/H+ antiporter MnhD subunit
MSINYAFHLEAQLLIKGLLYVVPLAMMGIIALYVCRWRKLNKDNIGADRISILDVGLKPTSLFLDKTFLVFGSFKVGDYVGNSISVITPGGASIVLFTYLGITYSFIKLWDKDQERKATGTDAPTNRRSIRDQLMAMPFAFLMLIVLPAGLGWLI